ncbi:MAG: acylphosphatase [Euryarchaeota archaeon]|nr:acylphosphatase [Euryarchaeota archaeon]
MELAVMIAKGEVRGVGYRDTLEKIARKPDVTGFVANPKSCDVRIVARW